MQQQRYPNRYRDEPEPEPEPEPFEIPLEFLAVFCKKCRHTLYEMDLASPDDMDTLEEYDKEENHTTDGNDTNPAPIYPEIIGNPGDPLLTVRSRDTPPAAHVSRSPEGGRIL